MNLRPSHTMLLVFCLIGCIPMYFTVVRTRAEVQTVKPSRDKDMKHLSSQSEELAIRNEVEYRCQDITFVNVWGNNLACRYYEHTQKFTPFLSETLEMKHIENFRFIMNASSLCSGQEVDLVFVVHTAPSHAWQRSVIRNTWGAGLQNLHKTVKVAFIVGESMVEKVNEELLKETEVHSDMIVVEMLDQYHKLSLKDILLFRWARDYCSQARFIMKCDDDVVVNPLVYTTIKEQIMTPNNSRSVIGSVGNGPTQRGSAKWGLPFYYYPFNWNPPYLLGPAVIVGKEASLKFLELSKIVPYIGIDDLFVFGILTSLGNITRVSKGRMVYGGKSKKPLAENPRFVWLTSGPEEMKKQWNEFIAPLMNVTVSSEMAVTQYLSPS